MVFASVVQLQVSWRMQVQGWVWEEVGGELGGAFSTACSVFRISVILQCVLVFQPVWLLLLSFGKGCVIGRSNQDLI